MAEKKPERYAVIGHPVAHSLSPRIHQAFALQSNQSILFDRIDVDPDKLNGLRLALIDFFKEGGRGCNITLPFKQRAFQMAESVSPAADKAQAASCLYLRDDGVLFADNYDGLGLTQDLERHHHFSLHQKTILIIGAGGAVRGILHSLLEKAPKKIVVANRTLSKAKEVVGAVATQVDLEACSLTTIPDETFDLIIHATSLGHQGRCPFLPNAIIGSQTVCYDMNYGAAAEPFLKWAMRMGACKAVDGIGMLVELNAQTFYLWRGVFPETHSVLAELSESLALAV